MKVYVVTSGEYSSYGIEAIFLTREKAELYCANHNVIEEYTWYDIEEYDTMDDSLEGADEEFCYRYYINPQYKNPYVAEPTVMRWSEAEKDRERQREWNDTRYGRFPRSQMFVYAYKPNKSQAVKIVQDRYAKWKAEKEGLT